MKKFLFFMILGATSLLFPAKTSAQNALINAERIGWYDAEYPIITWGGVIGGSIDVVKYINNLVDDNAGENKSTTFKATDETAYFGSRVERIDGIDAKGMNSAKFNSLMAEPRSHTLLSTIPQKDDSKCIPNATSPSGCKHTVFTRYMPNGQLKPPKCLKISKFAWTRMHLGALSAPTTS